MTNEELVEAILDQMLQEVRAAPPNPVIEELGRAMARPMACDIVASGVTFLKVENGKAIMCLCCGSVSHNPSDVERCYCGWCHLFLADKPA